MQAFLYNTFNHILNGKISSLLDIFRVLPRCLKVGTRLILSRHSHLSHKEYKASFEKSSTS